MNIAGYLVNKPEGLVGIRGEAYSYVMAGNGLFIEAENRLLAARIPVAECDVRGLPPLEPAIVLRYGPPPVHLWMLAMDLFFTDPHREKYVGINHTDGYHLYYPEQTANDHEVTYAVGDNILMDIHSHGKMPPFWSGKDNRDEQGFKLFCVVGQLTGVPSLKMRIGVYGYFHAITWADVFDSKLFRFQEEPEGGLDGTDK